MNSLQDIISCFAPAQAGQRQIVFRIENVSNSFINGSVVNDSKALNSLIGLLEEKDRQINRLLGIIEHLTRTEV